MEALHMSGAGNDFVVVDARGKDLDLQGLSIALCKKSGADGFLALDESELGDFRLHFYNPDGSRGEMCGNGARCICKYAFDKGVAGETMTVQTDAGLIYGTRLGENYYRIRLNNPGVVDLHCRPDAAYVELGSPGIPHSVTEYPALIWTEKASLLPRFLAIRNATEFPKAVNVNFFRRLNAETVRILTYERGVEDFTLACGTGSAAVAVALFLQGQLPNGKLTAKNPGGVLHITVQGQDGQITALYLEGPAENLEAFEI